MYPKRGMVLKFSQDSGDVTMEAVLTGEKGYYDCPIRIYLYGTSDPRGRASLEARLKQDRLLKATQLKQTRQENDAQRRAIGLKNSSSNAGLGRSGSSSQPEISLEELTQTSQAVQFRAGGDYVKTLAMDEDQLAQMPKAPQPDVLRAQLLPYQLQVACSVPFRNKLLFICVQLPR
jgi:SWI/SNF-related matrix-associated actin-dependent regulator of chromatin subfamily A3